MNDLVQMTDIISLFIFYYSTCISCTVYICHVNIVIKIKGFITFVPVADTVILIVIIIVTVQC